MHNQKNNRRRLSTEMPPIMKIYKFINYIMEITTGQHINLLKIKFYFNFDINFIYIS